MVATGVAPVGSPVPHLVAGLPEGVVPGVLGTVADERSGSSSE